MTENPSFLIYNASAGSGKTFALVKAYIKQILQTNKPGYYKHLLAITFTNKAVAEMKERIVETLFGFSLDPPPASVLGMMQLVVSETELTQKQLRERSKEVLKHLLHHYALFSVETIDHFNHRLIRTFARDLNLDTNFEVRLDTKELISQAVDQLINKAGEDQEVTKMLLEFALHKTDEDKSWDIAFDLNKVAQLLNNENDAAYLNQFKDKSLGDFIALRGSLREKTKDLQAQAKEIALAMMTTFLEQGFGEDHFSGKYLYRFFQKISGENLDVRFGLQWQKKIETHPLYAKNKIPEGDQAILDEMAPKIAIAFTSIEALIKRIWLLQNILKNIIPLATIHLVQQELEHIKEEENILPITEFNAIIHAQIMDQPAPFIYERLGERYRHFYIDEFQDTSALQWNNLIPLIDNALSQEYDQQITGNLLLVGDAKQSIYRWRGGLPEQFMKLYTSQHPFSIDKDGLVVENLDTNYRSAPEIVNFNNSFFSYVATLFGEDSHRKLYEVGNHQKHSSKENGYIKMEFVEPEEDKVLDEIYPSKCLEIVEDLLSRNYSHSDICILTRKKKHGIAISQFMVENGVKIISEETLLLQHSPHVQCLLLTLNLSLNPLDQESKISFLEFLHQHLHLSIEQHTFFRGLIHEPNQAISTELAKHNLDFHFEDLQFLSLFESFEYTIERLQLVSVNDAFLTSFMELVFNFSQRPEVGKIEFLDYWKTEKEKASISGSKNTEAVSIMTIHKAKGLEFPIVIFPYADLNIYKEIEPVSWYPWNESGFNELLINFKKEVAEYGEIGTQMVAKRNHTLELDNLNLLYVALTRAVSELYILANKEPKKTKPDAYNILLKSYLQSQNKWEETTTIYEFGKRSSNTPLIKSSFNGREIAYTVSSPQSHQIKIVPTMASSFSSETLSAIRMGNLLHDTMAKIALEPDAILAIEDLQWELKAQPELFSEIKTTILAVLNHPDLKLLFQDQDIILNEREIVTANQLIRPDRINIHPDNTVTIIDYKTGESQEAHALQISGYAAALQDMGYQVRNKLLVYCNSENIIINKA